MTNIETQQRSLVLVKRNPLIMMLGTVGVGGMPEIKR